MSQRQKLLVLCGLLRKASKRKRWLRWVLTTGWEMTESLNCRMTQARQRSVGKGGKQYTSVICSELQVFIFALRLIMLSVVDLLPPL